jgi:glycosyltransferase involved in cell wall biosynthesis/sulfatase maturation enzyme AslB (radical SAM superfamily)
MKFSIIIPTFNPEAEALGLCLQSAKYPDAEIILVDDCSTNWFKSDATTRAFFSHTFLGEQITHLPENKGPGAARNVGLNKAKGDWVIFLDSDDELAPGALDRLALFINAHPDVDAVGYGWEFAHDPDVNQRRDGDALWLPKNDLLKEYLKLRMDGSVIYTAVKRSVIDDNCLRFRDGLHEDIDFIFKVYACAKQTAYIPEILYRKTNRAGSIVRTVTRAHIDGFIAGWVSIGAWLGGHFNGWAVDNARAYDIGTIGVIATRVREVAYKAQDSSLMEYLENSIPKEWFEIVRTTKLNTQYAQIAEQFLFSDYMIDTSIFKETWSCTDLHNSLFLAPDEIRTCCKRFFVDGKMRGDVVLVDAEHAYPATILAAKQKLIDAINKGDECECTGCPFMEFKEWGKLDRLQVTYLSMEHHSVCNMKCTYCDETYYGKKQPAYDVDGLLLHLSSSGALVGCQSIVWGGGEPVLGKNFDSKVAFLMENTTARHRFLTNALVFSPAIANALRSGRATITTSIDAGTEKTFAKVRGTDLGMHRVLDNLVEYAAINAQAVTIKHILTEDNLGDTEAFKNEIFRHKLQCCNFQISADFKQAEMPVGKACAAIMMHWALRSIGCRIVFFDDLLMQRMLGDGGKMVGAYCACGFIAEDMVALTKNYPNGVVVFGIGAMTDWVIANTYFFKHASVIARNKYIPGVPVVITGSQGYADNYRKALAAGVPEELIVKGVVL